MGKLVDAYVAYLLCGLVLYSINKTVLVCTIRVILALRRRLEFLRCAVFGNSSYAPNNMEPPLDAQSGPLALLGSWYVMDLIERKPQLLGVISSIYNTCTAVTVYKPGLVHECSTAHVHVVALVTLTRQKQ